MRLNRVHAYPGSLLSVIINIKKNNIRIIKFERDQIKTKVVTINYIVLKYQKQT